MYYVTKSTRSTQPCIPLRLLNLIPALIGWGKGGNVTSATNALYSLVLCEELVVSRHSQVLVEWLRERLDSELHADVLMTVSVDLRV